MTVQVEAWYRERYLSKVSHKYKNGGFLMKGMVMPPAEMDGSKLKFPVALPGTAKETRRTVRVGRMNAGKEMKEVSAKWYEAPDMIYKMDINKTSAMETEVVTKNAADALGQAHDGAIFDAINSGVGTYGAAVGSFAAPWSLQNALEAETRLFEKTEVPREMAWCVLPVRAFNIMKTYKEFSNSQYVGEYPLAKGVQAFTWSRTHWVMGYDNLFKKPNATDLTFFMWFQAAIGSGDTGGDNGSPIKTDINYIPDERGWLHDNLIEVGATVLLPEAIQECKAKADAPILIP
jgi:hypothetical protein